MFTGKNEHRVLRELTNALELELYECAEVSFDWNGENTHSFNRLFAVKDCQEAPCMLTLTTSGICRAMRPHALYFLSAGDRFRFKFHSGTHFFSFHFNLRLFGEELFLHTGRLEELPGETLWIENIAKQLSQETQLHAAGCLKALLLHKVAGLLPANDATGYTRLLRDRELLNYLQCHANAQTTLSDLAELAGVSADTLSRRFSRDYGIPLKRRLTYAVATRAEHLLRNRELKIREVAERLRFRDEFYFSKFFKREMGQTPSEFRRTRSV